MQRSLLSSVEFLTKQNILLKSNYLFIASVSFQTSHSQKTTHNEISKTGTNLIPVLETGGSDSLLALTDACQILNSGHAQDGYSMVQLVRSLTDLGYVSHCRQLHGFIFKSGFASDVSVCNALLRFYRRVDSLSDAQKLFVGIPQPSIVSWNSLVSGYVQSGRFREALRLFAELERSGLRGDAYSFTAALAACGQIDFLSLGKSIHSKVVKCGLECGVFVGNCLIDMYGKCGSQKDAIRVFDGMVERDIISWNSIVAACARNGDLEQALTFWLQMSCPDTISYNELINGIAQFGNIEDAVQILSDMPAPNSSSWNSILTGYVNRNRAHEALEFFRKMHYKKVEMDEFSFSIILSGIGRLSALKWGMLVHGCAMKHGLDISVVVGSALIDMYSKCGQIQKAESLFWSLHKKNVVTWNSLISGYAHNGEPVKVIQYFEQMNKATNLKPDQVTFLNVLAACSHTVIPFQKAFQYLEMMIKDYAMAPSVEHCCSMIRIMGQRGEVAMAEGMIKELGFGSCGVVWKALLGACGVCKNLKVAKVAAAKVIELEGYNDYVYVMMSNILAYHSEWVEMSEVRKIMREKGVGKKAGCSWIEVDNATKT